MARKRNKKPRTIQCEVCGRDVVVTHNRARYCPECRVIVAAEKEKIAKERRKAMKPVPELPPAEVHYCDPPDAIDRCLSCTKPYCHGNCLPEPRANRKKGKTET